MKSSTQDKAKGIAKSIAGRVEEATGKAIGNPRLQFAGKVKQIEGKALTRIGRMKQARGK